MFARLAENVHLQYSELLQELLHAAHGKRGVSFTLRRTGERAYWYLEYTIGSARTAYYLGADNAGLAARISAVKQRWKEDAPDAQRRARTVAMLVAGGATTLGARHGRVLEALAQAGVFVVGGVLVGSHAFVLIANMLGVVWGRGLARTQDIDLASEPRVIAAVPDLELQSILQATGEPFIPVPALSRKHPITTFTVRGAPLSVTLLTPMRGKPDTRPRRIAALGAMAEPLRFLEYILEDTQPAAVPIRSGVLVRAPAPARFALHKLVVSQRRVAAFAEKARKDVAQAASVLDVLLEDRPGDVLLALDAAERMPARFMEQLRAGAAMLPEAARERLPAGLV